ncbi:MAG: tRNA (N(6)-L-threonylcarbamoyladenosine(37)-C(2))-methylthiotransferase MtaB [Eubacteriales bacterium]|nr:tRNA (N(6)-L-threonylcarbamoyladenosine(37)-C(2))-methylthiotransferase MtaB [Eubacteriales bacterium]MDY3332804.1 tRNA (N(6)-L-threonylcarbamoyladenosine(37)-C(2))-methylthiotransferase MtaB [Gallibacter sp.]
MRIAFHTLGCKVNQYETDAMISKFVKNGYEIVGENDEADVYLVNTCSVTNMAERKSRQYIRRMKKKNEDAIVVVAGCYTQLSADELKQMPEVDILVGTNEKADIVNYVENFIKADEKFHEYIKEYDELKVYEELGITKPVDSRMRAFVKIQEGCNRFCSYCIIPYARGNVRSRDIDMVIEECSQLISTGTKEIILTGINTALCENLLEILKRLDEMDGDFRVRLSSLEPTVVNKEYVKSLFKFKRLCHHLHLSVQSGSDAVLKEMNRSYNRTQYLDIVKELRNFDKYYGLTTDIIVGFPGETDKDFDDSLDIINKSMYVHTHAFKYSKRKGTKAAVMPNQVDDEIKKTRIDKLIEVGLQSSKAFFELNKGTVQKVLFEEYDEQLKAITGYTDNYIKVYLQCDSDDAEKLINQFVMVEMLDNNGEIVQVVEVK